VTVDWHAAAVAAGEEGFTPRHRQQRSFSGDEHEAGELIISQRR